VEEIYRRSNSFYRTVKGHASKNPRATYLFQTATFHQLSFLLMSLYGVGEEERREYFLKGVEIIGDHLQKIEEKLEGLLKNSSHPPIMGV
ncbi:MAG: hypothetical protein GXO19_00955, partial [Epsilonproteobacteria bacterium]|nr:hypothetical protein [Campylobacterota bacterium]NPA56282.1 hypothetical protein [Campylobacterota bacterium]